MQQGELFKSFTLIIDTDTSKHMIGQVFMNLKHDAAQDQWEIPEEARRRVRSDSAPSHTVDTRLLPGPAKFTGHI